MCVSLVIHGESGNRTVETQGELASVVGESLIVFDDDRSSLHHDWCLCPIDLRATAGALGYEYSELDDDGKWDAFDCHWRKKN